MTEDGNNNTITTSPVGTRLEEFYRAKGYKRPAFAELMGVKYEAFSKWIQGKTDIPNWFWKKLKEEFSDADIVYMLTGNKGGEIVEVDLAVPHRRIPVVSEVNAGNLNLGFADELVLEWIYVMNPRDKKLFSLRVKGDSMSPRINEGDYVICAPDRPFVSDKIYVVVTSNSEHTVKKVHRVKDGYLLVPLNPDFPTLQLPDDQVLKLVRVVAVHSKLE